MKSICIITPRDPTSVDSTAMAFVQQFAWAIADNGIEVTVICPLPVNLNRRFNALPDKLEETTSGGSKVTVILPKYWGFGQRDILSYNTARLTTRNYIKAVDKAVFRMKEKPEVFYGHFITPSGIAACRLGEKYDIPAFIGYGESSTWSIDHFGRERVKEAIKNVKGIIAVSSKNKDELIETGVISGEKINVFPNGFNPKRFSPRDKTESRKRFGLPQDAFIVVFVGHFIKRKGIDVLAEAVRGLDDVYLICAGKGELKPSGSRVLYADLVSPDQLSYFYSAGDVFVLPTLNEGCCNAIIEAMACGLPIISSNRSFNDDILDADNAIRIDPGSIEEVRSGIEKLRDNSGLRGDLSKGSLRRSEGLTLAKRTHNILSYIGYKV